jgi:hypothetical protein
MSFLAFAADRRWTWFNSHGVPSIDPQAGNGEAGARGVVWQKPRSCSRRAKFGGKSDMQESTLPRSGGGSLYIPPVDGAACYGRAVLESEGI